MRMSIKAAFCELSMIRYPQGSKSVAPATSVLQTSQRVTPDAVGLPNLPHLNKLRRQTILVLVTHPHLSSEMHHQGI